MMFLGVVIFFFLVVQPSDVGLPSPYEQARGYELVREEDELVSTSSWFPFYFFGSSTLN
jgi:hypothetical protein